MNQHEPLGFTLLKTTSITCNPNEIVVPKMSQLDTPQPIIAIISAYNETAQLEFAVQQARGYATKVIVIDDGSIDDTAVLAEAAGATVIQQSHHQGKSMAWLEAARQIESGVVVIIEGDDMPPPPEITGLIEPILTGQVDIVTSKNVHAFSSRHILEQATPKQVEATIIVVTYNGKHYLRNCITSLLSESGNHHEIIIVDNNSTDNCISFVKKEFPTVTVILNSENGGFGQGNNIGARYARGKFLAFLNQDTVVEPGWLEPLIQALKATPQAGLATPQILLLNEPDRINACGMNTHFTGISLNRGVKLARGALPGLTKVGSIMGAAFVMPKELFEQLSGFDEPFFLYLEEVDLSWRARLMGYQSICVPDAIVYHDYELVFGPKKTFYYERNRYLMLLKNLYWLTFLVLLPSLFLAEIVSWGFILLKRQQDIWNKLEAYKWISRNWSEIIHKRKIMQQARQVSDRELLTSCVYKIKYAQTGDGMISFLSKYLFDPIFWVLYKLTLFIVRW